MRARTSRPYIPSKTVEHRFLSTVLPASQRLSIIIPSLNESACIVATLLALQPLRRRGHEVILVDGGSEDDTCRLAEPLVDQLLHSEPGRGQQMNCGARHAWGDLLLFLHADTQLPRAADQIIQQAAAKRPWGRFNIHLTGRHPLFRVIETMINLRSAISGIATGDQAIFVKRSLFNHVGGYQPIPLMEDIALSKQLKRHSRPAILRPALLTSSRRWEEKGIIRTTVLMWRLRWAYFRGTSAEQLARYYR